MVNRVYNVVVIDDVKTILKVIKMFFSKINYLNVIIYSDPVEALENIENDKPDIIVSDINMPKITGISLLRLLREKENDIEFIIITANRDVQTSIDALQLKAANYLLKPFDMSVLKDSIDNSIEKIKEKEQTKISEAYKVQFDKMATIGLLVKNILHDIKNPLTYIKTNIENLNSFSDYIYEAIDFYLINQKDTKYSKVLTFIKDDFKKLITNFSDGALKIEDMIFQMQKFSFQGKSIEQVDVDKIIQEVLKIIKLMKLKNLKINYIKNYDEPFFIKGCFSSIQQAILNIVLYLLNFSQYKEVASISIETEALDGFIIIKVFSNADIQYASGNSPDKIPDSLKKAEVGLQITKKIIAEHSGKMRIDLKENDNSSILIKLSKG